MTSRPIRTVCSYCGVGCGIEVYTRPGIAGPIIDRVAGDPNHPVNRGRLCTKGATHAELLSSTDGRLTDAWVRAGRDHELQTRPLDEAITLAGSRLREIREQHGPDSIALYVSGQLSMEAQYLANKLAKGFIRTANIESNSRLCMASAASGYKQSLGADGPPGSYDDFDHADLFFVLGSNMADCHPILFLRMADRLRVGAKLIVVDPRRTATAERADLFLQIRPGTDLVLLNGLLHLLVTSGDIDTEFIARHTDGWAVMPEFLADYPPARVAELTGLAERDIRAAAAMIAEAREWMSCWTMGANQSAHATWNTNAICNLHLATGAICRRGSGPMSLTGQPNAMGGREMGYLGAGLPGQRSATCPDDRAFTEGVWGLEPGTIRADSGVGTVGMFERMAAGEIRACWIICTNPIATVPNRANVITALQKADLVITQDTYRDTATNRYADIILPAALWGEADGVMVNSERTLTLAQQCVSPLGQARPDWQLIAGVAHAMGFGEHFDYQSSERIFDEITQFANHRTGYDIAGADYRRLRRTPLQWPCPSGGDADRHPIRYRADSDPTKLVFATRSGRAMFHARPHLQPHEMPDADYPLMLNTGRSPHQWHTMTKTGRIGKLNKLSGAPFVEIHPDDAQRLGIEQGQAVEVRSRRGRAVLAGVVSDRVRPGTCFAPFHWNDEHGEHLTVNALTSDAVDPDSLQPQLKMCAVRITPVGPTKPPVAVAPAPVVAGAAVPLVMWASQTGNAEELAGRLVAQLADAGIGARLADMSACTPENLSARDVFVVTSTFGDGGPPDNGADFWARLQEPGTPKLDGTRFAVLGIGDRSYGQFCGYAKSLDRRMGELGADRLLNRADCEIGDHEALGLWSRRAVAAVTGAEVTTESTVHRALPFTRANPVPARLIRNVRLTPKTAVKDVRQFGFDISENPVGYGVGDALGVFAANPQEDVEGWLAATRLSGEALVEVDGTETTLRAALTHAFDIRRVTPDLLGLLPGAPTRVDDADGSGIDLVRRYPVRVSVERWLDVLVRLTPRLYSISSSPLVSPHEVQLTVSVVPGGVCSGYLANRARVAPVPVFLQRTPNFRPPEDGATPIVMIGAGTGIAPFRGFLQHRRALGHVGRNWLFFGDQHRAENFYYRDDLSDMLADRLLSRLDLAFSRDQAKRIYVQHRMIERGARLWSWLQDGACVYVCGDATHMARGVDAALTTIIAKHGRLSAEQAHDYKRHLVAEKRYLRDVY